MARTHSIVMAATDAIYLSKHCVFTKQPFDGGLIELVVQVLERCINAIAVQLISTVGQYHCLQQVTARLVIKKLHSDPAGPKQTEWHSGKNHGQGRTQPLLA